MEEEIEPGKIPIHHKVEKFLAEREEIESEQEHYVMAETLDMGEGLLPCILESRTKDTAEVIIADGPHTGEVHTIPSNHLLEVDPEALKEDIKKLF